MVAGGISDFEPESGTAPMPLSKLTLVALVEDQVSVTDEPRITDVGCAVTDKVGGPDGIGVGVGVGEPGEGLLFEPCTPEHEVARKQRAARLNMRAKNLLVKVLLEVTPRSGDFPIFSLPRDEAHPSLTYFWVSECERCCGFSGKLACEKHL